MHFTALFGPRIRNIPEIKSFRITSKKKSQQAEYDDFDFSGDTYETTDFENNDMLLHNISITEQFIAIMDKIEKKSKSDTVKAYVWREIKYSIIKNNFLSKYIISKYSGLYVNLSIFSQGLKK